MLVQLRPYADDTLINVNVKERESMMISLKTKTSANKKNEKKNILANC